MIESSLPGGWPIARSYERGELARISLPLGGIGTGTVGFGGRGQLRDWELENHPSKGLRAPLTFFACQVRGPRIAAQARILEGDLFDDEIEGETGAPAVFAGVPRFRETRFETTYPFARVVLSDPSFPVRVWVESFNPFSPTDESISSLPIASFRISLESTSDEPLEVSVMWSVDAFVGHRLRESLLPSHARVDLRESAAAKGFLLIDDALDPTAEDWGTLAAGVLGPETWVGPTWGLGKWNQGSLAMWRGFQESGRPGEGLFGVGHTVTSSSRETSVAGTLGTDRHLAPHASTDVDFLLAWHFPNRKSWRWSGHGPAGVSGPETVGNLYTQGSTDAWQFVERHAPELPVLRAETEKFVSAFWTSDTDASVKEAALFNLSTLRTQTFFRTADGFPFGWEGCLDTAGSCLGSCTHVWNYDLATAYLFGDLASKMRELEFGYATDESGAMSFRIGLPLAHSREHPATAADGQLGCVLKLYREWRLSGDTTFLERLWPSCRKSIEFAWIEGGWDGDRDGLAEGTQHNTMDVEYFGPNPVIQSWYLAALKAGAEMADAVGDAEFVATCRSMLAQGAHLTEELLYNGKYYVQDIRPVDDLDKIPSVLRHGELGAEQADNPEFQIGDGCLLDQLLGDTYARLVGLGGVFDDDHVKATLQTLHELNYVTDFGEWTNVMRTYGVRGERGHIVLSYPDGLPVHPMPYWSEVWTGLEYVYAIGLAQIGDSKLAEDVVAASRERFTGRRRNPFDEAECGHHYARAMASWGVLVALTGFTYDGRSKVMGFAASDSHTQWFWSTGRAWGLVEQSPGSGSAVIRLQVLKGTVAVESLMLGTEAFLPEHPGALVEGGVYEFHARA